MGVRVGVDTGGTFTDALLPDGEGSWLIHKCPTTSQSPSDAVFNALDALSIEAPSVELLHGTTHATNALLTGELGRVVMIVTRGFRDVLALGRQNRDALFDLETKATRPNQPRHLIFEAQERLSANGRTIQNLSRAEINRLVEKARQSKPQAIAVCFLHAWKEPKHEKRLGRALKKLGVPVVLSSQLAPEQREYDRASTVWADAGLQPIVGPALEKLESLLRKEWGSKSRLRVMRSDGGTCSAESAAHEPVHLALSGPAGGLSASRTLANARGDSTILTLDMGGTSTDVALLPPGELPLQEMKVAGHTLLARGLPLHTVGAGGGSLASFDPAGVLQVGPESAGANPGPACYGRGGKKATVTDAHLLCGRLHPRLFLDGEAPLDIEKASQAFHSLKANPAEVLEIACAEMERALRRVSLAEGHDPRELNLYAFGGAGALHAAWLANRLGMKEVVIPPFPGAFSALGLLAAPLRRGFSKSVLQKLPSKKVRRGLIQPLMDRAYFELMAEGLSERSILIRQVLELRSKGQSGIFPILEGPRVLERFHAAHKKRFGFTRPEEEVELVAVRLQADGPSSESWVKKRARRYSPTAIEAQTAVFPEDGHHRPRRASWYRREDLRPGANIEGPALVAEYSATTVVPPSWNARIDPWSCLVLRRMK